jgi:hypothetical protein
MRSLLNAEMKLNNPYVLEHPSTKTFPLNFQISRYPNFTIIYTKGFSNCNSRLNLITNENNRICNQKNVEMVAEFGWQSTSRKHGKKEPQSFSHCGSFDHPNLQSLNDCRFSFLIYQLKFQNFWGF